MLFLHINTNKLQYILKLPLALWLLTKINPLKTYQIAENKFN